MKSTRPALTAISEAPGESSSGLQLRIFPFPKAQWLQLPVDDDHSERIRISTILFCVSIR
jgi:hypothetical protein